jgi:MFS family permease
MFLLGMFPFGLLGLLFTIIGTINASRDKNDRRKATGYYNLFMGIIVVAGGIIGWIVLYLETS